MMIEPSPLPLPLGERGLRFGNLRKASALSFFVNGGSEAEVEKKGWTSWAKYRMMRLVLDPWAVMAAVLNEN